MVRSAHRSTWIANHMRPTSFVLLLALFSRAGADEGATDANALQPVGNVASSADAAVDEPTFVLYFVPAPLAATAHYKHSQAQFASGLNTTCHQIRQDGKKAVFVGDVDWVRSQGLDACYPLLKSELNFTYDQLPHDRETSGMSDSCQLKFYKPAEQRHDGKMQRPLADGVFRQLARIWLSKLHMVCTAAHFGGGNGRYVNIDAELASERESYLDALKAAVEPWSDGEVIRTETGPPDDPIVQPHMTGEFALFNQSACKPGSFGNITDRHTHKFALARVIAVTDSTCEDAQEVFNAEVQNLMTTQEDCHCFDEETVLTRLMERYPTKVFGRNPLVVAENHGVKIDLENFDVEFGRTPLVTPVWSNAH